MDKTVEQLKAETVELLDNHFPKGMSDERGSATVLHARMWDLFERYVDDLKSEARWLYHYIVVEPNQKFVDQILEDMDYKLPPPEAIQFLKDIPQYNAKKGDVWTMVKNGWTKPVYKDRRGQEYSARMVEVFINLGGAEPFVLSSGGAGSATKPNIGKLSI